MKKLAQMKEEYEQVKDAMDAVRLKGYGVVTPKREEIHLEEPVIIKQGSKFGVKIHSEAPSIHMIRANIETEIAPIVGSEKQQRILCAISMRRAHQQREFGIQTFSANRSRNLSQMESVGRLQKSPMKVK